MRWDKIIVPSSEKTAIKKIVCSGNFQNNHRHYWPEVSTLHEKPWWLYWLAYACANVCHFSMIYGVWPHLFRSRGSGFGIEQWLSQCHYMFWNQEDSVGIQRSSIQTISTLSTLNYRISTNSFPPFIVSAVTIQFMKKKLP